MVKQLSEENIRKRAEELDKWVYDGTLLRRQFNFEDFKEAMEFVNEVAELAEEHEHHPDIAIRYNKVRLALSTHSVGGITEKDFNLAEEIENI